MPSSNCELWGFFCKTVFYKKKMMLGTWADILSKFVACSCDFAMQPKRQAKIYTRCQMWEDVRRCEKISHVRRSFICRSIYTSFFLKNPSLRRSREKNLKMCFAECVWAFRIYSQWMCVFLSGCFVEVQHFCISVQITKLWEHARLFQCFQPKCEVKSFTGTRIIYYQHQGQRSSGEGAQTHT